MKRARALSVLTVALAAGCGGNGTETKIAFVRFSGTAPPDIYVMNADGSGQRRVTRNPEYDGYPALSPDGRSIAFDSERQGKVALFVMDADGSGQRRLTQNLGTDGMPAWSPGRGKIAFASWRLRR